VTTVNTKLKRRGWTLARLTFQALIAAGVWLMVSSSSSYLDLGTAHPFFLEKLPMTHPTLWWAALCVHVPCALLALPACLVLSLARVRKRWPSSHRWLGRATAAVVLLGVVPSGLYLAFFAQGGPPTVLGFWLTGAITFVAMVKGVQSARAGDVKAHRRWSSHVFAQLSVAVVSRLLLVGAELVDLYGAWVYVAALWIPVLGCALVAELLTGSLWKGKRREVANRVVVVPRLDSVR
jgi:uncharacterized membrane protein